MLLRRLLALSTSIGMLHLSVVAGDAACVTHGAANRPAAASSTRIAERTTGMHEHKVPARGVSEVQVMNAGGVAATDMPPCETPAQQHCCDALAGCSVTGAITRERGFLGSSAPAAVRIRELINDAPASFAVAPEPPPPKA